jgi:hypothetical protein
MEYANRRFLPESDHTDKFVRAVDAEGLVVMSDHGPVPVTAILATKPMRMYEVRLADGRVLRCADTHVYFKSDMSEVFAMDLRPDDLLFGEAGPIGVVSVRRTMHKVSMCDVSVASPTRRYYSDGVLSHNTVTAAVFMLWYMLFHKEKNVLVVADIGETTKEIIDKIKNIMNNLPFFMKPGIVINNVMSMKFDNDCRLIGRNTTRKTGIGLSINLLYMDEFAHIDESYLKFFYSNIYPTIEAMPNSKIIITSTPNGINTFHDLWIAALDKQNSYYPMRIDWWQAPGRDEAWKKQTIANLASEEDFNQNYGLQFFSADHLLLDSFDIKKIYDIKQAYVPLHMDALTIEGVNYSKYFSVHPRLYEKHMQSGHCDFKYMQDYFIFTIDTADGVGRDYSVCNIYKLAPLPLQFLLKHRTSIHAEYEIVGLIQVATFRSNSINTDKFADVVQSMLFRVFDHEKVRVVLELNHKGFVVKDRIEKHGEYWPGLLIHSKHTINAKFWSPGILLNSTQKKIEYCERFKYLMSVDRIIPNELHTVQEIGSFGKVNNGTFRSQTGNDDLAVSSVNMAAFFDSPQFYELCGEVYNEIQDKEYLKAVDTQIFEYNRLRENADRHINMMYLNELNQSTN